MRDFLVTMSRRVTEPRGLDPGNRSDGAFLPSHDSQDMKDIRVQLQWGRTVTPGTVTLRKMPMLDL